MRASKHKFWTVLVFASLALCVMSQATAQPFTVASGNWSNPAIWNEGAVPDTSIEARIDCRGNLTTVVDQPFAWGNGAWNSGLFGPGYNGDHILYVDSSLDINGRVNCGMSGNQGWIYVRDGGSLNCTGDRLFVGANLAGVGTGHLILEPGSTLNTGATTWVSVGDQGPGTLQVNGAGSTIYANQVRMESQGSFIVRPSANGAAGLTPFETANWIMGGTGVNENTGVTLVVEPTYAVSLGDSWDIVNFTSGRFNTFEFIATVPPDMGVSVDYTTPNKIVVTVDAVPGPPADPGDLIVEPWGPYQNNLSWTDNAGTTHIVERGTDGSTYPDAMTVPAGQDSYMDTGLDDDTEYYYRVYAQSPYGDSNAITASSVTGKQKEMIAPGDVADASIWEDGEAPAPEDYAVVRGYDLTVTNPTTLFQLVGPGFEGDSYATLSEDLTVRGGFFVGVGDLATEADPQSRTGTLIVDGVGLANLGVGGIHLGRSWGDGDDFQIGGHGNLYVKPNSTVNLNGGSIFCGHYAAPEGTGRVIVEGGGSTFNYGQLRFQFNYPDDNAIVVRPTANGAAGLSELTGSMHFVDGGQAHLEVAPLYVPNVGDSWTIASFSQYADPGGNGTQFAYVQTVPSDLAVDVTYNATDIVVTVTAAPTLGANQPTDLNVSPYGGIGNTLTWTDNGEEYGFLIERKQGASGTWGTVTEVLADVTEYNDTDGIDPALSYTYRVTALSIISDSAASTEATSLAAPTALQAATVDAGQIDLSWTDNATAEDGFVIERREDADGADFAEIATVGADVTTYSDTDAALQASTPYVYRVYAYNASTDSAYSNEASATTGVGLKVSLASGTEATMAVMEGYSVILEVTVQDALDTASYQWYKGTGVDAVAVGTNHPYLSFASVEMTDSGVYWCQVTAGIEMASSPQITMTVGPRLPVGGGLALMGLASIVAALGYAATCKKQ